MRHCNEMVAIGGIADIDPDVASDPKQQLKNTLPDFFTKILRVACEKMAGTRKVFSETPIPLVVARVGSTAPLGKRSYLPAC